MFLRIQLLELTKQDFVTISDDNGKVAAGTRSLLPEFMKIEGGFAPTMTFCERSARRLAGVTA
jgi:hypothetical protein